MQYSKFTSNGDKVIKLEVTEVTTIIDDLN